MQAMKMYDVYDNGTWIGSYTTDAITKLYELSKERVAVNARTGAKAHKRYTFKFLKDTEPGTWSGTWAKEWDDARLKILGAWRWQVGD